MRRIFILKRTIMGIIFTLIVIGIIAGGFIVWYFHRPLPPSMNDKPLFEGITYTRNIQTKPFAQITHIVKIDLDANGVSFLVTPSGDLDNFDFEAQTTSQFVDRYDLQLAINGDFFDPWKDYGFFNYYPHVGDGTNVRGLSVSRGEHTTDGYVPAADYATLFIDQDNHVSFLPPSSPNYNAISGNMLILSEGQLLPFGEDAYLQKRHPRTAVGLSQDERTLIIVVVDGRQPNYSEGATLPELAQILLDAGAYHALNLDGGGSSTLIFEEDGKSTQLNSPIQNRLPARERPIANHLGVYAHPLP